MGKLRVINRAGDRHAPDAERRDGKSAALGWFVGQVMKASGGKANPALVNRLLKEKLGG